MKSQKDFGSDWGWPPGRVRAQDSAETSPDSEYYYLGFRLAHDGNKRTMRGVPWDWQRLLIFRASVQPDVSGRDIGFRLTRNTEDE
jgi:hypothetical protein